jgi:Subtilase family
MLQPRIAARRNDPRRFIPLAPEVLARRAEIAQRLQAQIQPLSAHLRAMTAEERRAIFLKLEHDGPINLSGTGLKPIAETSERFTLAVPRKDDLSALSDKVNTFATEVPRNGELPNSRLVTAIETIAMGRPEDRLSQELLDQYEDLITRDAIICEVELLSLENGRNKQRNELSSIRHQLQAELNRDRGIGAIFEHEEIKGTCRVVIRCSGALFQRVVEEREWQRRIYWFEARPEFQTFNSIVSDFDVATLGAISAPADDAPTVCIVDSGVSAGNPFLRPVVREDLLQSFLQASPDDPSDGYGHGSGVASLAAYYALNLAPGADNSAKVWIASARILTPQNQLEDERLFSKLLRQVVEHFVARGVKIFNLSVNDRHLSWNRNAKRTHPRRSWTARIIDQLSREHDVVFVVSTGNILTSDVRNFQSDGKAYPAYFADDEACMLDPGQSAYALTVGSIAPTTLAEGATARARAIALRDEASPFTRCGPGIRKEIKPEIVDYGGNLLVDEESGHVRNNRGLSLPVASNQLSPAIQFDSGTSLAAPRVSHKLALVLQDCAGLALSRARRC